MSVPVVVAAVPTCFIVLVVLYKRISRKQHEKILRSAIKARIDKRNQVILSIKDQQDKDDESERRKIISKKLDTFKKVVGALQEEKYSPLEVLHAFQEKAIKADEATNCVTQFIGEAEQWAKELEKAYPVGTKKPPLYGVPVSIKESISLKGYDSTRGYPQELGVLETEDAHIINTLKQLGAIPFCLTNVPQSLLSYTCSNPIYGRTLNPRDASRTCGGSSGGEGALIALGGSLLGVGGDVGGSIRIPAHFCGITGMKPCSGRLCQWGCKGSVPGRPLVSASCGPMARDVDTLVNFFKLVLNDQMFIADPYVAPVPFREHLYKSDSPMSIGYYDFDGWFEVTPGCRRAVSLAKESLEQMGHKLVPWQPPNVATACSLFAAASMVDGGKYLKGKINYGLMDPLISKQAFWLDAPFLRSAVATLLAPFYPRIASTLKSVARNTSQLRQVYADIQEYRATFMSVSGLDCIICPTVVTPALPHDYPQQLLGILSYTVIFNLLDMPAGAVPVSTVNEQDQKDCRNNYPVTDPWDRLVKKASADGAVGLPLTVQCVALPFQEEICLRLMKEVEIGVAN